MPAAAGRVDHLEAVVRMQASVGQEPRLIARLRQPELLDRRVERAVEDELLDEDGRLEQRVLLAGGFGEVLVEVAEEPGVRRASAVSRQLSATEQTSEEPADLCRCLTADTDGCG